MIIVDLDEGSVKIPDGLMMTKLDDTLNTQLINNLCLVLRPQLSHADNAFETSQSKQSPPHILVIPFLMTIYIVQTYLLSFY